MKKGYRGKIIKREERGVYVQVNLEKSWQGSAVGSMSLMIPDAVSTHCGVVQIAYRQERENKESGKKTNRTGLMSLIEK